MTTKSRIELLKVIQPQYLQAGRKHKTELLAQFQEVTGYSKKHAITLLNKPMAEFPPTTTRKRKEKLGEEAKQALVSIWLIMNRICSKRLAPFLAELVDEVREKSIVAMSTETANELKTISASTIDRALKVERKRYSRKPTTTKRGSLVKNQVPVRTFTEWNDVLPGFFEIDTVAHCESNPGGQYLSTLNMTDIATCWTEPLPLFRKGAIEVVAALDEALERIPFPVQGIDSDNGSEFLNHEVLDWCRANNITFTRSRAYKKNDQAWIEEKNKSVVRRSVGGARFQGDAAWRKLDQLYTLLRLYVNFYQPCQKLVLKKRDGARTYKTHDVAKTPYRRVLESPHVSDEVKELLKQQRLSLNLLEIHQGMIVLQDELKAMSIRVENPLIAAALAQRLAVSRFLQRDNEQEEQSVASEDQSIASEDQSIASEGQSIASEEQSIASEGQSIASEDQSIASEDQSIASEDQSIASEEQSIASEEQSVASEGQSVAAEGQSVASEPQRVKRKTTLQNQLLSLISMMSPGHIFGASELVSTNADYAFKTLCEEGWIKRIGSGRFKVLRCPSSRKALIPEKIVLSQESTVYKVRAYVSTLKEGDMITLGELEVLGSEDAIHHAVKCLRNSSVLTKVGAGRYCLTPPKKD